MGPVRTLEDLFEDTRWLWLADMWEGTVSEGKLAPEKFPVVLYINLEILLTLLLRNDTRKRLFLSRMLDLSLTTDAFLSNNSTLSEWVISFLLSTFPRLLMGLILFS